MSDRPTDAGLARVRKTRPLADLAGSKVGVMTPTTHVSAPSGGMQVWHCYGPPLLVPYCFLPVVVVRETLITAPSNFHARLRAAIDLRCAPQQVTTVLT
jgi:hypothetical protein